MIAIYHLNIKDERVLLISLSDKTVKKITKENEYTIGYDQDDQIVFINLFTPELQNIKSYGFIKPTQTIIELVKNKTHVDLNQYDLANKFVVAEVIECTDVPNTHLHQCVVFDGKQKHQIVCGAKNVHQNLKTVLAKINACMPNGTIIKPGKLMNIESFGMLCSKKELQIDYQQFNDQGIIELDQQFKVGEAFDLIYK